MTFEDLNFKDISGMVSVRKGFFEDFSGLNELVHCVLIATKPDIIKQAPLIIELNKRGKKVMVCHTGQHYDWNLSGGLEQEFGINPDLNLNISGPLHKKQAQVIYRLGEIFSKLKKTGTIVLPYPHGDTLTAFAGGVAAYMNQFATAHVEAGIRTLTPPKEIFNSLIDKNFNVLDYYNKVIESTFESGSNEPYPEQFDTRCAAATAGIHLASVELNKQSLLAEGFSKDRIFTVGNTVSDSIKFAEKRISQSTIFEKYPTLENGEFIRFCMHRRENISSSQRFKSLYKGMRTLVKEGENVLLISLRSTEAAFKAYRLSNDVKKLDEQHTNFIYSPVWPFYTDVIAATKKCALIATDSGSMQEECNILGKACATLRFNSDRSESIKAGANILVPPIRDDIVHKIVKEAARNDELNKLLSSKKNLYGENVSKKIVNVVDKISSKESIFRFDHNRLGFDKYEFWEKDKVDW